jgi:hypothetical protein
MDIEKKSVADGAVSLPISTPEGSIEGSVDEIYIDPKAEAKLLRKIDMYLVSLLLPVKGHLVIDDTGSPSDHILSLGLSRPFKYWQCCHRRSAARPGHELTTACQCCYILLRHVGILESAY